MVSYATVGNIALVVALPVFVLALLFKVIERCSAPAQLRDSALGGAKAWLVVATVAFQIRPLGRTSALGAKSRFMGRLLE